MSIRQSLKTVLNKMLLKNIGNKVKIIHEAIPQLYLEHVPAPTEGLSIMDTVNSIGKVAGKEIISKLVEALIDKLCSQAYESVSKFFKARAEEFKKAQAEPQDGVTIKLTWNNVQGMSSIRAVINAIRGEGSIGNLNDLTIPNFSAPEIKIIADKKFD
jgi:hypothetical protein